MRVGRILAAALDPEKPLFQDLGPLNMLPDEIWHPDCRGTSCGIPSFPPAADAAAVSPAVPAEPSGAFDVDAPKEEATEDVWEASHEISTMGWPSQTAASDSAGQSASKELLGLEEGGVASSSKNVEAATESDSDDDLQPYNLDEDDSEGAPHKILMAAALAFTGYTPSATLHDTAVVRKIGHLLGSDQGQYGFCVRHLHEPATGHDAS